MKYIIVKQFKNLTFYLTTETIDNKASWTLDKSSVKCWKSYRSADNFCKKTFSRSYGYRYLVTTKDKF